jgi:phosphoribosylanthranilate isomerase
MSVLVKICGITTLDDAFDALDCGADLLGFNFYPDSKRYIDPIDAKKIFEDLPPAIPKVGIFVNADQQLVVDLAVDLSLDILQFHGDETPEYCSQFGRSWWRAFRPASDKDILEIPKYEEAEGYLIDAYVEKAFGGTGVVSNWDLAVKAKKYGKIILSGGLKPDNIEMALQTVKPYAVDVASGVEDFPGVKNLHKMEEFIAKVRRFS